MKLLTIGTYTAGIIEDKKITVKSKK